ncbi:MAG: PHP domain-containing protein [Actinomycetia bacterium]|nr:PHP domain-containing protein [Actinomycetes bacterium]
MRIDLHAHSTASDGTDTPAELVARARANGLDVVAVTDHDSTAGWGEAIDARPRGLTLVPGAEFSCVHIDDSGRRTALHLLGYLFDPDHPALRAERARLRGSRRARGAAIVANLVADGVPISWDRVRELAGSGVVGRPHIARALVEAGVVATVGEAFEELLSSTSKHYVRKDDTEVFRALALVRAAGGVAVFAHPYAVTRGPIVGPEAIAALAAAGLAGVEANHPDHDPAQRAALAGLAGELGLIVTGASDYHGANKLTPLGACVTDPDQFAALVDRATARQPVSG